jgi:hypothetical protein
MKKLIKNLTFILTVTLYAQTPMQALWGWGNSQSTKGSKSSWATWIFGGVAAIGAIGYLSYRYLRGQKQQQKPAGTTTIVSGMNQRPTSQNENGQEVQRSRQCLKSALGTPSLNVTTQAGEIRKAVKDDSQDDFGILLELNRVHAQRSVQYDINKCIRTGNF